MPCSQQGLDLASKRNSLTPRVSHSLWSLQVPGSILNQFAMDEYNGMFRIATTYGRMWGRNADSVSNIFIFGPGGEEKGKVCDVVMMCKF